MTHIEYILSPVIFFACPFSLNNILSTIYFLLQMTNPFLIGPTMMELLGCRAVAKLQRELRAVPVPEWGPPLLQLPFISGETVTSQLASGFREKWPLPLESSLAFLGQRERGICTLRAIFRKP